MINYAYVNTDEQLKAESLATATVIAGATGLPPVIQAINQTILLILAVEESLIDITALLCGYKVPLFKQHASFQMRYSEICMVSKSFLRKKAEIYKKGGGVITGKAMSYMQYLGMLMALTVEKSMRERAISLIETDLRERYNQTFCIDQCIDLAKVKVVVLEYVPIGRCAGTATVRGDVSILIEVLFVTAKSRAGCSLAFLRLQSKN